MERSRGRQRRPKKAVALGESERRSLIQLVISLAVFLMVFAGQEFFPENTVAGRAWLSELLRKDTDFRQIFSYVGEAMAEGGPVLETMDTLWVEVFGGEHLPMAQPARAVMLSLRMEARPEQEGRIRKPGLRQLEEVPAEPRDSVLAAVQDELGLWESSTPVLGVLTSGFGVREHPIDGETKMHDGVDLAADEGVEILAFAEGTVDYIGESPMYGMYLQLRHDNGVTSFYAHCSELLVQKGMKVKQGDVVARVGDTGNATGPHLHFEMKKDGVFVNPLPYIHYLNE